VEQGWTVYQQLFNVPLECIIRKVKVKAWSVNKVERAEVATLYIVVGVGTNGPLYCSHTAGPCSLMIDCVRMGIEIGRGKLKCSEKNLQPCDFVVNKLLHGLPWD
jgi:hypothetical protein